MAIADGHDSGVCAHVSRVVVIPLIGKGLVFYKYLRNTLVEMPAKISRVISDYSALVKNPRNMIPGKYYKIKAANESIRKMLMSDNEILKFDRIEKNSFGEPMAIFKTLRYKDGMSVTIAPNFYQFYQVPDRRNTRKVHRSRKS